MKPTPFLIRVLSAIATADNQRQWSTPKYIAKRVFGAEHPGWRRVTKCGHGSTSGGGLVLMMGGYLGKLRRAGLTTNFNPYSDNGWRLTNAGHAMLKEHKGILD